jgi:hypothetical protein
MGIIPFDNLFEEFNPVKPNDPYVDSRGLGSVPKRDSIRTG